MKHTDPPIINEHTFNRPARDVWNALSVQKEMVQWFFDNIPAFEARVGFETRFAVQSENRTFTHCWKVLEAIPNQKLTYSWKYEEYPGDATVTFELNERGNTTWKDCSFRHIESLDRKCFAMITRIRNII